jgi:hypothetical protein
LKVLRSRLIFAAVVMILGYLSYEVWKRDHIPQDTEVFEERLKTVESQHDKWISKIVSAPDLESRKKAALNYLDLSSEWLLQVEECLGFFRKHRAGKTMRVMTRLSARALQARQLHTVIKESRSMLKNAMKGFVAPRHQNLLRYESIKTFERLFPRVGESKP